MAKDDWWQVRVSGADKAATDAVVAELHRRVPLLTRSEAFRVLVRAGTHLLKADPDRVTEFLPGPAIPAVVRKKSKRARA